MEQLLWTYDDLVRFIAHPDAPVRRWALNRLTKRFPDQAGAAAIALLDDPNTYIVFRAAEFLHRTLRVADTGDAERYGPVLLDRLRSAQGRRLGYLAQALARLQVREALPPILAHLRPLRPALGGTEFTYLVGALGQLGGAEARQVLGDILQGLPADSWALGFVLEAALHAAQPADIPRLVQVYRSWDLHPAGYRTIGTLARPIEATRLTEELVHTVKDGPDAVVDYAAWWMGLAPILGDECRADLAAAFARQYEGVFPVLLREAHRLVAERGDGVAEWQAAWAAGARVAGYRYQAPFTLLLLEALAASPCPRLEQRQRETALGLALLCRLSVDHDDQAVLDAVADTDPAEALLTILAENREQVLPDVVERVVALGPAVAPRLAALLDPDRFSWGMLRAVEALELLARRYPGSCDAAIPTLIAMIYQDQSDYLKEACTSALVAIGPAVVEPAAAHLRDDDFSRQIYLTGALGEIPTAQSAQAILGAMQDSEFVDEIHLSALTDTGSPTAIEPLYALWQAEAVSDHLLAGLLLVLCAVNGVTRPELPEWRRIVRAEEARMERLSSEGLRLGRVEPPPRRKGRRRASAEAEESRDPATRPTPKPKTVSRQELKKRKAQRQTQRQKGKKKRKR